MKRAIIATALVLVFALCGCGMTTRDESVDVREVAARFKTATSTMNAYIITDTETGVQYLFISHGYDGGLTPLLDAEGKPVVGE
ncbi:MAG: hypothetical protein IJ087_19755 [Eggerthellaceae bacterium]|nr:hypothetical protein [Eggerthellaceae bacterium]